MARIATSIEESKRLLELGINPESADMYWSTSEMDGIYEKEHPKLWTGKPPVVIPSYIISIPAWSLGALIELLPPKIIVKDEDGELRLWLNIQKMGIEYKSAISEISEMYLYGDLIVSIIVAIESLVEQGYIKTKKE